VQALFSGVNTGQKRESVPLGEKMLLSLPQAAEVSGVPVAYLRAAVKAKRLKTVAVGGGYGKVKRVDLETYVENL
jgi:excisionase family DNA binding protein